MITEADAERIATEIMGPASAPDGRGWRLIEFDAGWLIRPDSWDGPPMRGGEVRVVERAGGRVIGFASWVSPERILTAYDQVVGDGFVDRDQ
jgi:hypothetical protein